MRKFYILLGAILTIILIICLAIFALVHFIFAVHVPNITTTPATVNLVYATYDFTSQDGTKLDGWYVPVANAKAIIILVHGFDLPTGGKTDMLHYLNFLHDAGYATFLFDLRSFGNSDGNLVSLGVKEWMDVAAAYDFVKQMPENTNLHVGFMSESMGSASTIIAMGKTGKGDFAILSVPFASIAGAINYQIKNVWPPLTIFQPIVNSAMFATIGDWNGLEPKDFIASINKPIIIFGAAKDRSLPPEDAKTLFDLATSDKKFYWQANTRHNIYNDAPTDFQKKVLEFLNQLQP